MYIIIYMFCLGQCIKKNKILVEFYKNTPEKIISQMENFYSTKYKIDFIFDNIIIKDNKKHYLLYNCDKTKNIEIEAELINNGLTYHLIVYNVILSEPKNLSIL